MTTNEIFKWIDVNLKPHIDKAIADSKAHNPILLYTPDWLIGIVYRESGQLIAKRIGEGFDVPAIWAEMKGDYTQRKGETEPKHHGFSNFQIDIDAYPDFINSGAWKDPYLACMQAIRVLEGNRLYLDRCYPKLGGDELYKAITSAYNCGVGNIDKAIKRNKDLDIYTTSHDYSTAVWKYRGMYLMTQA